jgi:hypothetical protein
MNTRIAIAMSVLCTAPISCLAVGDHEVRGYVRQDGTYVAPHMQTNPNNSLLDNYSTRGNVNPYTGKPGTVDPYRVPAPRYEVPPAYVPPTIPSYQTPPLSAYHPVAPSYSPAPSYRIRPVQPIAPIQPIHPIRPLSGYQPMMPIGSDEDE